MVGVLSRTLSLGCAALFVVRLIMLDLIVCLCRRLSFSPVLFLLHLHIDQIDHLPAPHDLVLFGSSSVKHRQRWFIKKSSVRRLLIVVRVSKKWLWAFTKLLTSVDVIWYIHISWLQIVIWVPVVKWRNATIACYVISVCESEIIIPALHLWAICGDKMRSKWTRSSNSHLPTINSLDHCDRVL